jgi:hypothetical protein
MCRLIVRLNVNAYAWSAMKMTMGLNCLVFCMTTLFAEPPVKNKWLVCEKNSDCTSVVFGCWYWQPLNKTHGAPLQGRYVGACTQSLPPGPQPTSSCVDHMCVNNPYTGKYWTRLERYQSLGLVEKRMTLCFKGAGKEAIPYGFDVEPYVHRVDAYIRGNSSVVEKPLDQIIASQVSCQDVLNKDNETKTK